MNMDDLTFKEALEEAKEEQKPISILLGNGFSMACLKACERDSFSYTSLFDEVKDELLIDEKLNSIGKLFDLLKTKNFEIAIREIEKIAPLIEYFFDKNKSDFVLENINPYSEKIKEFFLLAVKKTHPNQNELKKIFNTCGEFLRNFGNIFTLNYDLFLYWGLADQNLLGDPFNDGFCRPDSVGEICFWSESFEGQNIFYLHGALHIFSENCPHLKIQTTYKLKNTGFKKLTEHIDKKMKEGYLPLYVSEGDPISKLNKITTNHYLKKCYDALRKHEGILFTYGVSFENDAHVLSAIGESKLSKLFIGRYNNNPDLDRIRKFLSKEYPFCEISLRSYKANCIIM